MVELNVEKQEYGKYLFSLFRIVKLIIYENIPVRKAFRNVRGRRLDDIQSQ